MKILFVCSSNVCRSPFAEFVFGRLVEQSPVLSAAGIEVGSSAVFNRSKYIYPKAVVSLEREGFSKEAVLAHKPAYKSTDKKRFEEADVIIGMSKIHRILTPHRFTVSSPRTNTATSSSRCRKRRPENTLPFPTPSCIRPRTNTTR